MNGYVFTNSIVNKTHSSISDIAEIKDEYFFDFTTSGIHVSGVFDDSNDYSLTQKSIPTIQFKSDKKYKIWGLHFYSHGMRDKEFREDMEKLSK